MSIARRVLFVTALIGATMVAGAQDRSSTDDAELQMQFANLLYEATRFSDALDAYKLAARTDDRDLALRARIGIVRSALRMGDFTVAQREAASLRDDDPTNPEALSAHADALWSAGLFDEAEQEWRDALAIEPGLSRGRHGLSRALASQGKLELAMNEAQAALKASPRDGEIHHTVGSIYERMRRFEQAAASYSNFINLLPGGERSEKAAWSRAQVRFLESFGDREPVAIDAAARGRLHTMPFEVVDEKVIVKARVNGGDWIDFVLDTGSEQTTISRQVAASRGVRPITYTLSAGVGEVGLRGLQLGRIDTFEIGGLTVRNVPVLIKSPALRNLPKRETESFSPLALGLSMTVDYANRQLTVGEALPDEPADFRLPMRHHRLAMVRGLVNESHPTYFVVDTGGEVISISTATADALAAVPFRKIGLRVYGTSGWDRDAFLLPGVNISFSDIAFQNFSVVVLNLKAPSVLLGFQVGGIVGHRFLSPYRVSLDLNRSEVRLTRPAAAD